MTPALAILIVLMLFEERDHVAMGFEEVIHQRPDLLQAQLGGGVRVEHGGVVDVRFGVGERGGNDEFLHVDVGAVERGEVGGQVADL